MYGRNVLTRRNPTVRIHPFLLTCLLVVASVLSAGCPARAEVFLDFYGGYADFEETDVKATRKTFIGGGSTSATRTVEFDNSPVAGFRYGYWFESAPWLALGLDISYFKAKDGGVKAHVVPFTPMVLLRIPLLKSPSMPKGRLQPYIAAGPAVAVADVSVDFQPDIPVEVDGLAGAVGPDLRAGIAVMLHKNVGLFGEFRYTKLDVELDSEEFFLEDQAEFDIETWQALFGLTFRYGLKRKMSP
jgi:opacity protein-like surface antigen